MKRQTSLTCETHKQFMRLVEWAKFLGLQWNFGRELGVLRIGQGRWPMTYMK